MNTLNIFEFEDYRDFLRDWLSNQSVGDAPKKKIADFIGCQPAFVSHVLSARNDFSLEQAEGLARFMRLDSDEIDYFVYLVGWQRSGTENLKTFYQKKMDILKEKTRGLKDRLKIKEALSENDEIKYYSRWYYAAIHMAVTVPTLRTKLAFEQKFSLAPKTVDEATDFLVKKNLLKRVGTEYFGTSKKLHLEKNSPLIVQHHSNWRLKALESISREEENDLHYSGVITCSKKDFSKIKGVLVTALARAIEILGPSKEEEIGVLNLDLFKF